MSTYLSEFLVPSNVQELSTYGFCTWLDHHIFKDTSLSPTGYDFTYPLTAYGGPLSAAFMEYGTVSGIPNVFVSGGPLYEICYQDFCYRSTEVQGQSLFCVSTVTFILTALDETVSEIIKIMYDFGDGSQTVINSYEFTNPTAPSPKDLIVSHEYYPTEKTITTYIASVSVLYNNCCINTYNSRISSYRCGILEMYENVKLLDATQTKDSFNILMVMEDAGRKQIFDTLLDLDEPMPYLSAIPGIIEPVPVAERAVAKRTIAPRLRKSPVRPPKPFFFYRAGPGVTLGVEIAQLDLDEAFIPLPGISLEGGLGAPYLGGDGITIRA